MSNVNSGTILAVCSSATRGNVKQKVDEIVLRRDWGIEGDAHAGHWHRQVSLLPQEGAEEMEAESPGLKLKPGIFAENVRTRGLDYSTLEVGQRLRLGTAVVQVTQIGKQCHHPCAIQELTGRCIMPEVGIFVRVVKSGVARAGDEVSVDRELNLIRFSVITASDRAYKAVYRDESGPKVAEIIGSRLDAHLVSKTVLPDDRERLADEMRRLADGELVDLIVTTGGTGLAATDVTPEATRDVIDREIPGMAELIRCKGYEITPAAILSRGIAGVRGRTIILNLSGSPKAVAEQLDIVLPVLPHAVRLVAGLPVHDRFRH